MYDATDLIKGIVAVVMCVALLTLCIIFVSTNIVPMWAEGAAVSEAHAGEIVDKKIINAHSGLFTSSDMDYRLVIKVEYEWKGETKETEKSISVDKETYQQANIGDWFDSHTLEVTKTD